MNRWQGAALAALSAALLLAGCGAPETENDAAQEHQITYEHICERNKISALLERHEVVTIVRESTDSSNGGQNVKSTDQYTRDEKGRLQSWSHGWYYYDHYEDDRYEMNVCSDEVPNGMNLFAAGRDKSGVMGRTDVTVFASDEWYEKSAVQEPFLPVAGNGITVETGEPYKQNGQLVMEVKHYFTGDDSDYSLRWFYIDPTSDDLMAIKMERHRKNMQGKDTCFATGTYTYRYDRSYEPEKDLYAQMLSDDGPKREATIMWDPGTEREREQRVTAPLNSLLYLSGSEELRPYYDAAMTEQYQSFKVEWPEDGSTTVYVKSGDSD